MGQTESLQEQQEIIQQKRRERIRRKHEAAARFIGDILAGRGFFARDKDDEIENDEWVKEVAKEVENDPDDLMYEGPEFHEEPETIG